MEMTNKFDEYVNAPLPIDSELNDTFGTEYPLIIFDIGACEGEDSIRYSKKYPNTTIYSFEPVPENFKKLQVNIEKYECKNVIPFRQALSDSNGHTSFHVSEGVPEGKQNSKDWTYGNKSSSILPPSDEMGQYYSWLSFNKKIEVETKRLDSFCKENNIPRIDIIHMDVQGAELMVLKGAGKMIKKVKMIWMEVEKVELYQNQPLKNEVENYMKKKKFSLIKDTVKGVSGDQLYLSNR